MAAIRSRAAASARGRSPRPSGGAIRNETPPSSANTSRKSASTFQCRLNVSPQRTIAGKAWPARQVGRAAKWPASTGPLVVTSRASPRSERHTRRVIPGRTRSCRTADSSWKTLTRPGPAATVSASGPSRRPATLSTA